jgi:small subunit ribosomal protein S16
MIKIKLLPRGKKHEITYLIVVAESRSKSDGKFIADLGFYTPQTKTLELDKKSMADWQKKGAQVSEGVDKLLNPDKYPKKIKAKKTSNGPVEPKKEETKTKESKIEEPTPTEETKSEETKTEETPQTE